MWGYLSPTINFWLKYSTYMLVMDQHYTDSNQKEVRLITFSITKGEYIHYSYINGNTITLACPASVLS